MSQLVDRYVATVLRSIPESKKADTRAELATSIEDAIEGLVEAEGRDREEVEREVLNDLGDPARLASEFSGRPQWLLGPPYYQAWQRLLRKLLAIAPPIAGVANGVVRYVSGDDLLASFFGGIGVAFWVALNVLVWVTVGFVIAERSEDVKKDIEPFTKWSVDRLPAVPDRQISYGETIGAVVMLVFLIVVFLVQRQIQPEPFFDPSAWTLALPVLIGLLAVSALFEIVKYKAGMWSTRLALANAALNTVFAGWFVWFLLNDDLINPAFFENIGFPGVDTEVSRWMAAGVILVSVWDTVEGFVGASKARRGRA